MPVRATAPTLHHACRSVAVLPGVGFVSASHDFTAKVWTLSGDVVAELLGHTALIYAVDALPNGLIATGACTHVCVFAWVSCVCTSSTPWTRCPTASSPPVHAHMCVYHVCVRLIYALDALPNGLIATGTCTHVCIMWVSLIYALDALPNDLIATSACTHACVSCACASSMSCTHCPTASSPPVCACVCVCTCVYNVCACVRMCVLAFVVRVCACVFVHVRLRICFVCKSEALE